MAVRERISSQPLWLASRSPRRALMLEQAGIAARIAPADLDDAALRPGRASTPEGWVVALAYLKARRVAEALSARGGARGDIRAGSDAGGMVLGADTLCVGPAGELMGQPRDAADAARMLRQLRAAEHRVITGVALLPLPYRGPLHAQPAPRVLFVDIALVRMGAIADSAIDAYVASGAWRGKAGAYNLSERIEAGWPIECLGDPATVMGLPMRKLRRLIGGRSHPP